MGECGNLDGSCTQWASRRICPDMLNHIAGSLSFYSTSWGRNVLSKKYVLHSLYTSFMQWFGLKSQNGPLLGHQPHPFILWSPFPFPLQYTCDTAHAGKAILFILPVDWFNKKPKTWLHLPFHILALHNTISNFLLSLFVYFKKLNVRWSTFECNCALSEAQIQGSMGGGILGL